MVFLVNVDDEEELWCLKEARVNRVFVRKTSLAHSRERWGGEYLEPFSHFHIVQGLIYMFFGFNIKRAPAHGRHRHTNNEVDASTFCDWQSFIMKVRR